MHLHRFAKQYGGKYIRTIVIGVLFVIALWIVYFLSRENEGIHKPCKLPEIYFYDKSLDKYFWREKAVNCNRWQPLMGFNSKGYLRIHHDNVKAVGLSNIQCDYSPLRFNGLNEVILLSRTIFRTPVYVEDDFIYVSCSNVGGEIIYSDLLFKIHNLVKERKFPEPKADDQLSIIMIGLDSVSRFIAERELPLTMKHVKEKLGAYVMEGYTKVGDNTLPNLLALILGKTMMEFFLSKNFYSDIMDKLSEKGYVECHTEDWAAKLPFLGFQYPYFTHYLRRYILAIKTVSIFLKNNKSQYIKTNNNPLCFGVKMKHNIVLDYGKMFLETYENYLKFLFVWLNEIGHHQPNRLQLADADIKQFFEWLHITNKTRNSIIMLVSDHGPRYSQVLESHIGRFTGRLPLLAIILPQKVKEKFPHLHRNLLTNTKRLTTPFDAHEMIIDILNHNLHGKYERKTYLPRGISLFQEIPRLRSCSDAGISEHYCPCYSYTNISTEANDVSQAAEFVVGSINEILKKGFDKCAKLSLHRIIDAKLQHSAVIPMGSDEMIRYVLVVQTVPGNALFEASVRSRAGHSFELLGDINRNNKYADQSYCVKGSFVLELYCFCKI